MFLHGLWLPRDNHSQSNVSSTFKTEPRNSPGHLGGHLLYQLAQVQLQLIANKLLLVYFVVVVVIVIDKHEKSLSEHNKQK